jgi:hypothetical protein
VLTPPSYVKAYLTRNEMRPTHLDVALEWTILVRRRTMLSNTLRHLAELGSRRRRAAMERQSCLGSIADGADIRVPSSVRGVLDLPVLGQQERR